METENMWGLTDKRTVRGIPHRLNLSKHCGNTSSYRFVIVPIRPRWQWRPSHFETNRKGISNKEVSQWPLLRFLSKSLLLVQSYHSWEFSTSSSSLSEKNITKKKINQQSCTTTMWDFYIKVTTWYLLHRTLTPENSVPVLQWCWWSTQGHVRLPVSFAEPDGRS